MWVRRLACLILLPLLLTGCAPRHALAPKPSAGEPSASAQPRLVSDRCIRVIDGDTIHTRRNGPIRLIGVDAPEHDEDFFTEAQQFVAQRVDGKEVRLEICPITPKDRYGRYRAIVFFRDGDQWVNLNRLLVAQGMAVISDYRPCHISAEEEWREDEQHARQSALGVWAKSRGESRR